MQAALALLDEVGLDELTMRRLAQQRGVKASSLSQQVHNKEELLTMLGDEMSGEIPAERYPPTAMNPACPRLNWPVWPLIRFRLVARMIAMPTSIAMPR